MKVESEGAESGWDEIHYVLVHGAGHGGWCWYKLRTLLEAEGHKVTTVDLTSAGIDPTPFYEVLTFSQYNHPLTALVESLPDNQKVVLVGHSLGGLNITDVLFKFPDKILVAVYIAAAMMKEGITSASDMLPTPKTASETPVIDIVPLLSLMFGVQIHIAEWDMVYGPEPSKLPGIIAKREYQRSMLYNMSPVELLGFHVGGDIVETMPSETTSTCAVEPNGRRAESGSGFCEDIEGPIDDSKISR